MEKKDFLNNLDFNKDEQISKEDVKILGNFLLIKPELLENLEKDKKFKDILFALKPSFENLINSKDFIISPENRENIIILQFFSKFFRGQNIELNGVFDQNTERLYLDSIIKPRNLNQNTFSSKEELEYFNTWMRMNDSIKLKTVSREEFEKMKPNIYSENSQKLDGDDKPKGFDLYIPDDLKDFELPFIIKSINEISYGKQLPERSAINSIEPKIQASLTYLKSIEKLCSSNPELRIQYEKLFNNLSGIKRDYFPNQDGFNNDFVSKSAISELNAKLSFEFSMIENPQVLSKKDDPRVKLMLLEKIISSDLNKYLTLSVFERGSQTLFDFLNTPTKSQHEYLLDPEKRKEAGVIDIDGVDKIERMSDVKQKLKDSLKIEEYKVRFNHLDSSDINGKISLEKEICQKILEGIYAYPRTSMNTSENSQPAKILETQRMVCAGKSIIAGEFLQEIGIKFDTLNVWGHSALMVYLSDGKEYYFDPTNATDIAEFTNKEKVKGGIYEKRDLVLPNKFENGGEARLEANGAMTDSDGKLHFSIADNNEFGLMGQLYVNKGFEDLPINQKIFFTTKAMEINPLELSSYINLSAEYLDIGDYKEAVRIGEKGLKIDPENPILIKNLYTGYFNLAFSSFNKGDKDSAISLAKNSLDIKENFSAFNILGRIALDSGDYDGAYNYFLSAIDVQIKDPKKINIFAVEKIEQIIDRFDSDKKSEAYNKIGNLYSSYKDIDKAILYYQESIDSGGFEKWRGYYNIGAIEYERGNLELALENFEKSISFTVDSKEKEESIKIYDFVKNKLKDQNSKK